MMKRTKWKALIAIAAAGVLMQSPADAALVATGFSASNLQGYWQFDESNSASPPLANPTPDQSGNARNGTYQTNASRLTDGTFSPAVLGGTNKVLSTNSAMDYEVNVAQPSPLTAFGIGGAYTVSLWVKPDSTATGAVGTMISTHSLGSNLGWRFGYVTSGGNANVVFLGHNGTYLNTISLGSQPFTPNQWQMMSVTFDGAGNATIYRNGAALVSTNAHPLPGNSGLPLAIGGQALQNANEAFKGQIDEVAIWNTALTGSQVSQLYLAYLPEPASAVMLAIGGAMVVSRRRRNG